MRPIRFTRFATWVGYILLTVLAIAPQNASAGFDTEKFRVSLGVGVAVPARGAAFRNEASEGSFRIVSLEYEATPKFTLGAKYDKVDFEGTTGQIENISWGPYAIARFDVIRGNRLWLLMKLGANKSDVSQEGGVGAATDFAPQWDAFGGVAIEFDALGDARVRVGVDFWDMYENRIGAWFVNGGVNFSPVAILRGEKK